MSSILKSICIHSYQFKGLIIHATHKIHNILKIFDHTIHHIAISVFFLKAATILAANSGKLVQIATIVTHIKDIGTQKSLAIFTALSTINFHHKTNQVSHIMIYITDFVVENICIEFHSIIASIFSFIVFFCFAMVKV
jgi:hypothetical protein